MIPDRCQTAACTARSATNGERNWDERDRQAERGHRLEVEPIGVVGERSEERHPLTTA